jgi:hypothetical protein
VDSDESGMRTRTEQGRGLNAIQEANPILELRYRGEKQRSDEEGKYRMGPRPVLNRLCAAPSLTNPCGCAHLNRNPKTPTEQETRKEAWRLCAPEGSRSVAERGGTLENLSRRDIFITNQVFV